MNKILSKSLYTRGLQCKKSLWLKIYKNEVLTRPDEQTQGIFDTGNKVGELACRLFPNGKKVLYEATIDEKIALTTKEIDEGVADIYEATFKYSNNLAMIDILHKNDDCWEIYEVKSSTEIKDIYIDDVAFQYYILKSLGLNISKCFIIHIDSKYVRGDNLEIGKLFIIDDVTDKVKLRQSNIANSLQKIRLVLEDKNDAPDIDIGTYCFVPYDCDGINYCWKNIPEYSIFNISRLTYDKKFALYNNGIITFNQLEGNHIKNMGESQQIQIRSELNKKSIIDREAIKAFVYSLSYPLYYLDFETFQQAIPEWKGVSPFAQIPFQFSVHIEYKDRKLEHKEFLATDGDDPRFELAKALIEAIPIDVTVLAYNMGFEKGIIKKLAGQFPEFNGHLMNIHNNIRDLMVPFQNKNYYSPDMRGSYSIKYVFPALVPEMANEYKELDDVHNGGEAMQAYARMSGITDNSEKQKLRDSLLAYCSLDTLAMVKIVEKLRKSIK